jgi:hypothetical protein
MKLNLLRPLGLAVCMGLFTISSSCSNATSEANSTSEKSSLTDTISEKTLVAQYSCPMKCEKDKTYAHEGQCPVCGMDLKKTN